MGMIDSKEAITQLKLVYSAIDKLMGKTQGNREFAEVDENISYKEDDEEERLLQNEIYRILGHVEEVKGSIKYLTAPIKDEGYLYKNAIGRYELNGYEYTCGYGIEVYLYDRGNDRYDWFITRIEHNGDDYYAVGHNGVSLNGVKARRRDI